MAFLKRFYWLRIFIFVIIPILLSIWLFVIPWSFEFDVINQTANQTKNIQILKYSPHDKAKQFTSNFLSDVLHIPLQINLLHYCFKDKGTFLEYYTKNGSEYDDKNFNWTLNFNNEKNFTILHNEVKCELIDKSKEFTYNWQLNFLVKIKSMHTLGFTFHPNTTSFAKKDKFEVIQKSITLILTWTTICWMLHGVWNILNKPDYRLK